MKKQKVGREANKSIRGGGWSYTAFSLRATFRYHIPPSYMSRYIGARLSTRFVRGKR